MLNFIKMKYHDAYLLYSSVLFVVIVVFTVIENFSANWSQRLKKLRIAQVCTFLCLKFLISTVKTKTKNSCSRFEIKWQLTWFRHGFLDLLICSALNDFIRIKKY